MEKKGGIVVLAKKRRKEKKRNERSDREQLRRAITRMMKKQDHLFFFHVTAYVRARTMSRRVQQLSFLWEKLAKPTVICETIRMCYLPLFHKSQTKCRQQRRVKGQIDQVEGATILVNCNWGIRSFNHFKYARSSSAAGLVWSKNSANSNECQFSYIHSTSA